MAHFTAGFDFGFAIEMHCRGGVFDDGTYPAHIITDQVLHHHIAVAGAVAERPVGNRADMLLKLIHNAAVLGPMARVVHSRGDFIDDQPLRGDK